MEKNIASYDLSDMMVQKGLHDLSRRFNYKHQKGILKKAVESVYKTSEQTVRFFKRKIVSVKHSLESRSIVSFDSTQSVFYFVSAFTVVASFLWFMLLMTV